MLDSEDVIHFGSLGHLLGLGMSEDQWAVDCRMLSGQGSRLSGGPHIS